MEIKIFVVKPPLKKLVGSTEEETKANKANMLFAINGIKSRLCGLFGGLTGDRDNQINLSKKGYWVNDLGDIEQDNVFIWRILTNKNIFDIYELKFYQLIDELKTVTKQVSQLYTINFETKAFFR